MLFSSCIPVEPWLTAMAGDLQAVQAVINAGADINAGDKDGYTFLHFAAYRGRLEIVRWLIEEAGAKVELRSERGETPLHRAAEHNHLAVLKYLATKLPLSAWEAKDDDGKTPLERLSPKNRPAIEHYLTTERFLVFAMGRHQRVGAESPVKVLPNDVMHVIYDQLMQDRPRL